MRKMVGIAVAGALLLPAAVKADNICAPSDPAGFYACASVSVNWDAATNSIVLAVRNLDAWDSSISSVVGGYRLVGVGLTGDPSIVEYLLGTLAVGTSGLVDANGDPSNDWSYSTNLAQGGGRGSGTVLVEGGALQDPGQDGSIVGCNISGSTDTDYFRTCSPSFPGAVTFSFRMSAAYTQAMFAGTSFTYGLRGIAGPNDVSFKCEGATCIPTTTVPEPVSMMLLGTGLLGVGVVARRRRRAAEAIDS